MHRIIFLLCITITVTPLFSQDGVFIGIDGSYNYVSIINQNNYGIKKMNNTDDKKDYEIFLGVHLGYKFNFRHQLRLQYLNYSINQDQDLQYSHNQYYKFTRLNYNGVALIYRYTTGAYQMDNEGFKFYLEAGPMYSFLNDGILTHIKNGLEADFQEFYIEAQDNPNQEVLSEREIDNPDLKNPATFYKPTDILAYAGLGMQLFLGNRAFLSLGLHGAYSLLDINAENWQLNNSEGDYLKSGNMYLGLDLSLSFFL